MNYYNPYYNGQPMNMMPQMAQPVPVQAIQRIQKSAEFYTVENAQELDGIKPTLNVLYVGFNKNKKEIYVKQLTNDGLISVETYNLADDKKQKSEFETILEKINSLENKLLKGVADVPNNATNGATGNADTNVG
ncbi:MAG: hypothetical protein J6S85_07215 [Methanobrevibacter sp.]|nr:hypothetical protein [Methanobrevibacter sp.]